MLSYQQVVAVSEVIKVNSHSFEGKSFSGSIQLSQLFSSFSLSLSLSLSLSFIWWFSQEFLKILKKRESYISKQDPSAEENQIHYSIILFICKISEILLVQITLFSHQHIVYIV